MNISVIVPVLNEIENLPHTLKSIAQTQNHSGKVCEVIIVDGGSLDGTREWTQQQTDIHPFNVKLPFNIKLMDAERGRGRQLDAGATKATGDVLLFLHGDCQLPAQAMTQIAEALADSHVAGGCFLVSFRERRPVSLRIIAGGINARTRVTKTGTGDQAIFVRREIYQALGGFKPWPLFEDVDIVTRIKSAGKFVVIHSAVTISARRWIAHGPWRTTLLMYGLRIGYWLGVSPVKLKEWFADVRR
jgi:rSAM/selenodomain-associated transferase 2